MNARLRRARAVFVLVALVWCAGANAADGDPPVSQGTVVWQTGAGNLGQYRLPSADDGQCSGVGPSISGHDATFTVLRNRSGTYDYHGAHAGASTCWRNQIDPKDAKTGTNFLLDMGSHYTFTFQTVVVFNGNYFYGGTRNGGLAADIPAIVWQTHSYNEVAPPPDKGGPCDLLVIQNTYRAYVSDSTQYGTVAPGGLPTWNFHTCDESGDFSPNAYNSPDTLHDGEVDTWQIDVRAQIQGRSGGWVAVRRNGKVVYNRASHVCDDTTPKCFWNFGPYMFFWKTSEAPPGWNNAGVTVEFRNMTLYKR